MYFHQSQPQYSSKLSFVLANIGKLKVWWLNCNCHFKLFTQVYKTRGYEYFQLDGSTPSMLNVNNLLKFIMIQLLTRVCISSYIKSRWGVGLTNLIGGGGGGNHLVLFDVDWNPAHDVQSMCLLCLDRRSTKNCCINNLSYLYNSWYHWRENLSKTIVLSIQLISQREILIIATTF